MTMSAGLGPKPFDREELRLDLSGAQAIQRQVVEYEDPALKKFGTKHIVDFFIGRDEDFNSRKDPLSEMTFEQLWTVSNQKKMPYVIAYTCSDNSHTPERIVDGLSLYILLKEQKQLGHPFSLPCDKDHLLSKVRFYVCHDVDLSFTHMGEFRVNPKEGELSEKDEIFSMEDLERKDCFANHFMEASLGNIYSQIAIIEIYKADMNKPDSSFFEQKLYKDEYKRYMLQMAEHPIEYVPPECFQKWVEAQKVKADALWDLGAQQVSNPLTIPYIKNSLDLYHFAAKRGNVEAMHRLSRRLNTEEAIKAHRQDEVPLLSKAATYWLRAAVAAGSQAAIADCAQSYLDTGDPAKIKTALEALEYSAAQGDPEHAYHFGALLNQGVYMAADTEKAYKYFSKAAKAGNQRARLQAALCKIKSKTLEEVEKGTQELIAIASVTPPDSHALDAMYYLGRLFIKGNETQEKIAIKWLERSVAGGSLQGRFILGVYHFKEGIGKKWLKASLPIAKIMSLLHAEATQSDYEAMYVLGLGLLIEGQKYSQPTHAMAWLKQSFEGGNMKALQLGAELGDVAFQLAYAERLLYGTKIAKDEAKAKKILNNLVLHRCTQASEILDRYDQHLVVSQYFEPMEA